MTPGVPVNRCTSCGAGYFPTRLICMRCGGDSFQIDRVLDGNIEQTTVIRHAAGHADWQPHHLATVRTSDGQVIIVGLDGPLANDTRVNLFDQDGMITAREARSNKGSTR
jgi:uncharacterized OB-fold protein